MTETPDIANVRIEFDNGCVANLTSSRISMKKMRRDRPVSRRIAYIGIDFLNKKTEIIKSKGTKGFQKRILLILSNSLGQKDNCAVADPVVPEVNAIKKELEEFSGCNCRTTQRPSSPNWMAWMAMDVAHQILRKIGQQCAMIRWMHDGQNNQIPIALRCRHGLWSRPPLAWRCCSYVIRSAMVR